jgi:hypothetical protein
MLASAPTDLGHRETVTDLPHPTSPVGVRLLGILGLPAVVLSWASLGVTLTVLVVLQATPSSRVLFRLPVPPSATALSAAALAGLVVYRCRERPGRRLPRSWPLVLIGISLTVALGSLVDTVGRGAPWRHAGGLACLAGASVLLVRLVPVQPDRRWIEMVAPAGLAGAVLLVLLPALIAGQWGLAREIEHLERALLVMHEWAQEVRALGEDEVFVTDLSTAAAEERLKAVIGMSFDERDALLDHWRAAAVLNREEELAQGLSELSAAVVVGLDPANAPRISSLDEPPIRWDPGREEWLASTEFRRLSALVGAYYRRLGGLFLELDPQALASYSPALATYRQRYSEEREDLRRHLEATLERWTDHWVVTRVPGANELVRSPRPSLDRLLQVPLVPGEPEAMAPADVGSLLTLSREQARSLAEEIPGCHLRRYREDDVEYERVDCYALAADPEDGATGAELRVEMRVVFRVSGEQLDRRRDRPAELYFLFPVPRGRDGREHLVEVAGAMSDAVRARWPGELRSLDRSGSALQGFVLLEGAERIVVYRPRIVPFLKGREAVVVRAERVER